MTSKYALKEGVKLATFKIDESDWEAFKALCEENGTSASRTLINFIQNTLNEGRIDESVLPKAETTTSIDVEAIKAQISSQFEHRFNRLEALISGK